MVILRLRFAVFLFFLTLKCALTVLEVLESMRMSKKWKTFASRTARWLAQPMASESRHGQRSIQVQHKLSPSVTLSWKMLKILSSLTKSMNVIQTAKRRYVIINYFHFPWIAGFLIIIKLEETCMLIQLLHWFICGQPSLVKLQNIHFSNIRGTTISPLAVDLRCSGLFPCQGVTIRDIDLKIGLTPTTSRCVNTRPLFGGLLMPPACA